MHMSCTNLKIKLILKFHVIINLCFNFFYQFFIELDKNILCAMEGDFIMNQKEF